jgi:LysM repeat protein
MTYYSQKNPNWAEKTLGTCNQKFKNIACFLTSFCNLAIVNNWFTYTPVEMNEIFLKNKLWVNGCNIDLSKIAKFFDLHYEKTTIPPNEICIAETDKFAPGQHFFVWRPEDCHILDPLDLFCAWRKNNYHIKSYRVLSKITQMQIPITVTKSEIQYITTGYVVKRGDTLWSIAKDFYNDPQLFTKIAEENGIKNPNKLKIGQVLKIPGFE